MRGHHLMSMPISNPKLPGDEAFEPVCSIFRRFLKKQGLRMTTERAEVLNTVWMIDGVFEIEQLLARLRDADASVSRATVYRTIKHLTEAGIIQEVLLDSKISHYQLVYGRKTQDYMMCIEDDRLVEFHSPELVELRERLCREAGLEAVGHRMLIYAVCSRDTQDPAEDPKAE